MNSPNAFEVRCMNLHYGSFHALKNINLDIPKNQITALIATGVVLFVFILIINMALTLIQRGERR